MVLLYLDSLNKIHIFSNKDKQSNANRVVYNEEKTQGIIKIDRGQLTKGIILTSFFAFS